MDYNNPNELVKVLRDYLTERNKTVEERWAFIQQHAIHDETYLSELDRHIISEEEYLFEHLHDNTALTEQLLNNFMQQKNTYIQRFKNIDEPFEFYRELQLTELPEKRLPSLGIQLVPFKYHEMGVVTATETLPETGFTLNKNIARIISDYYPQYQQHVDDLLRPLGTTDATFKDFNREQKLSTPLTKERQDICLELTKHFLGVKPYRPVHYIDSKFSKLPLSTGTGYHNRCSYNTRTHAKFTRPDLYRHKPTSKGYFYNTVYNKFRHRIHCFKRTRIPYNVTECDKETSTEKILAGFYLKHPTMLFTRNHISKRDGPWKQRPVYAVDDLFLNIETMLTLPLVTQARKMDCCIMYSLETIRGACHYLDAIAKEYLSYFTIDWSSFDQTMPRVITDLFFTEFLPSLIIINHGTQPTFRKSQNTETTHKTEKRFNSYRNLLNSLHNWYNNMVFVTADGFAYKRTTAGVPSGQFLTQYLDSFGNLIVIIDGLLEYGFTIEEIKQIRFFIMGDDNSGFTHIPLSKLETFIQWFEQHSKIKWNMTLSKTKSIITNLRQNIELLSYKCNFGTPTRPLSKLVAQLCYPEHGIKAKYMSYRAIGIAFAAAGMDPTFHSFCRDIYLLFFKERADLDQDIKDKITKHLPGIFKTLDNYFDMINLEKFPTIHEVRQTYSEWQGELGYAPKWDPACFLEDPAPSLENSITILDYEKMHNIPKLTVYDIDYLNIFKG